MNVQQAIQTSANVIRVTNISAGDVYKRFDDSYDERVYYGVVTSVHNDGSNAIIEAVEYAYKYGSLDVNLKVLRGDREYKIFPSSPDELNTELDDVVLRKNREISNKREEILKIEREIVEVERLMSGERLKELKSMSYKEMTQDKFEQTKIAAAL